MQVPEGAGKPDKQVLRFDDSGGLVQVKYP